MADKTIEELYRYSDVDMLLDMYKSIYRAAGLEWDTDLTLVDMNTRLLARITKLVKSEYPLRHSVVSREPIESWYETSNGLLEKSYWIKAGTKGVIIEVDSEDSDQPYFVDFDVSDTDEFKQGLLKSHHDALWCFPRDITILSAATENMTEGANHAD